VKVRGAPVAHLDRNSALSVSGDNGEGKDGDRENIGTRSSREQ